MARGKHKVPEMTFPEIERLLAKGPLPLKDYMKLTGRINPELDFFIIDGKTIPGKCIFLYDQNQVIGTRRQSSFEYRLLNIIPKEELPDCKLYDPRAELFRVRHINRFLEHGIHTFGILKDALQSAETDEIRRSMDGQELLVIAKEIINALGLTEPSEWERKERANAAKWVREKTERLHLSRKETAAALHLTEDQLSDILSSPDGMTVLVADVFIRTFGWDRKTFLKTLTKK